jgi:hypothetical protein
MLAIKSALDSIPNFQDRRSPAGFRTPQRGNILVEKLPPFAELTERQLLKPTHPRKARRRHPKA